MPDKKYRGISNLPIAIPDVPDAPTVSAADVGTSRAYNNGSFRGRFAGAGMTYDPDKDEFVSPEITAQN